MKEIGGDALDDHLGTSEGHISDWEFVRDTI